MYFDDAGSLWLTEPVGVGLLVFGILLVWGADAGAGPRGWRSLKSIAARLAVELRRCAAAGRARGLTASRSPRAEDGGRRPVAHFHNLGAPSRGRMLDRAVAVQRRPRSNWSYRPRLSNARTVELA